MPQLFRTSDGGAIIVLSPREMAGPENRTFDMAWSQIFNRAGRTEDARPSNKPLAQGKPSKRSAKGNVAKAGKQARKSAGKKRGR